MVDRLEALLEHFPVSARIEEACRVRATLQLDAAPGAGHLLLFRQGGATLVQDGSDPVRIDAASLVLLPRPGAARIDIDAVGAETVVELDVVRAWLHFEGGTASPIAGAMPMAVVLPLDGLHGASPVPGLVFDEAFDGRCGRRAMLDRLLDVLLVQALRTLMEGGQIQVGLLAGMGHARLRHALVAMHEQPHLEWTLEALAERAGMSRSVFAASFRDTIGVTPGQYLQGWRTRLVQQALRRGHPLKRIAVDVGYGSEAALSRAFKAQIGQSPRQWRQALAAS